MTKTKPTEGVEDATVRPFADFFRELSGGHTHDEMSETMQDLIAKVRDTGKKGYLQLTIFVGPLKGDTDVLLIEDKIKVRLPEHDRKASAFYPDKHNNLRRTDPRQLDFESLREVPPPPGVDNADKQTGEIPAVSS